MTQTTELPDENNQRDIGRRTRDGFIWILSTSAIWQVVSWAITLIVARILTPKDFGIAALPGTIVPYLGLIASLHLQTWVVQTASWDKDKSSVINTLALCFGLAAALIAFVAAPYIAQFYEDPTLLPVFQICSLIFLIDNISLVASAELHREIRFKEISLVNMFVNIAQSATTLVMALAGFGYWSLIAGIMANHLGKTAALLWIKGFSLKFKWDSIIAKNAIRFGVTAAGASAMWIVFSTTDDIVVGKLFGPTELGFYTMAFFFSQLPLSKLNMIVSPLLTPYYSNMKNSGASLGEPFLKTCRTMFAVTAPALVGLSVTAEEAIVVAVGAKWISIVPIVKVLSIVAIMQSISMNTGALFNSLGKPSILVRYNTASAILLPIMFILGGIYFNTQGVYLAWLLGYPIILFYILTEIRKELGVTILDNIKNLRAPLVSSIAMAIAVILCREIFLSNIESPYIRLPILVIVGLVAYPGMMFTIFKKDTFEIIRAKKEIENLG